MNRKPLAAAIALALGASSASAINIETGATGGTDVPNELFSAEFQAGNRQVELPPIVVDIDAGLSVGDLITLTFNSPITANNVTTAFGYAAALPTVLAESAVAAAPQQGAVAFRTAAADGSSVTYRVTTVPTAAGGADEVGGLLVMPTGLYSRSGGSVTVSATITDGLTGDAIESSTTADTVLTPSGSQYAFTVTNLSETIDVNSSRRAFLVGTATNASHTVSVAFTDNAISVPGVIASTGAITHTATRDDTTVTIAGDFAWLDSSPAATGIQLAGVSVTGNVGGAITPALNTSGAIAFTIPEADASAVIVLGAASTVAIPEQTLTVTSSIKYDTTVATTGAVSGISTGAYSLNGSSVTVYSIPTNASNFIWLTNTGSTDGAAISATIEDAGVETDLGELAVTADSNDQVDVWPAVLAAVDAAGVELTNPARVNLTLVTEAPDADIAVSGLYKVGEDRVNLVTSLETDQD